MFILKSKIFLQVLLLGISQLGKTLFLLSLQISEVGFKRWFQGTGTVEM